MSALRSNVRSRPRLLAIACMALVGATLLAVATCTTARRAGGPELDAAAAELAPARVQTVRLHASAAQGPSSTTTYEAGQWTLNGPTYVDFPLAVPVGCMIQSWHISGAFALVMPPPPAVAALMAFTAKVGTVIESASAPPDAGSFTIGASVPVVVDDRSYVLRFGRTAIDYATSAVVGADVAYSCP